ncbi:MAG TPA: hypothetical protein ENK73_05180, partial [Thiomicrospira sp.]|nr:hypothetical protein [Thiomicrospira sp.]
MTSLKLTTPSHKTKPLSPQEYRQHMMLTVVAPFGSAIFLLLSLYDTYMLNLTGIAFIPGLLSLSLFVSFIHYSITKKRIP